MGPGGRLLSPIERGQLAGMGVVVHEEGASGHSRALRLDEA
jgi:hypothetical protein